MKRSLLIEIVGLTLTLTASAQMPQDPAHRNSVQRKSTYGGYRIGSDLRQAGPQRTFSNARFREPAVVGARFRETGFASARMQPRMSASFTSPSTTTSIAALRETRAAFRNDQIVSKLGARPRSSSAFVNRFAMSDVATVRQTRLGTANDGKPYRLSERARTNTSLLKPFTMNDTAALRPARTRSRRGRGRRRCHRW